VRLLAKLLKVGLATEPLGPGGGTLGHLARSVEAKTRPVLDRTLAIRDVDAGSCNGCAIETGSPARGTTPNASEFSS
jgi:hypothetical protein